MSENFPEAPSLGETRPISAEALRQLHLLQQGSVEILPYDDFVNKLQDSIDNNRPLRVKYGADPSAPDLHLGHMVPIRKLRQFQDLGHHIVFIIGDFTAMIGDPSGKSETRKRLTADEVKANASTYFDQVFLTLDPAKTEVVYNSAWLGKLQLGDIIELAAKYTVARMLERDDFEKRFKSERPIYIHEFLYPLVQAYDSVAIRADVEIGGTDQKFNFLLGREIQREMGMSAQAILTMPLLVGLDGVKKMSKSLGNYIGISEPASEIFGKTMSIPDEQISDYLRLLLGYEEPQIRDIEARMKDGSVNPRDIKANLAHDLAAVFKGNEAADEAVENFNRLFREHQIPDDIPQVDIAIAAGDADIWVAPLLVKSGLSESNSQARKAIAAGSVRMDGARISDETLRVAPGEFVLQVGKRNFRKIRLTLP